MTDFVAIADSLDVDAGVQEQLNTPAGIATATLERQAASALREAALLVSTDAIQLGSMVQALQAEIGSLRRDKAILSQRDVRTGKLVRERKPCGLKPLFCKRL
jgi:H2-forming N5,N10-methylenetetrahydromethanopterin dehydrogenase-like enzyme